MTPWTHLLEALHSSLIDEVNTRLPDDKPELGLPRRLAAWALPDQEVLDLALTIVEFEKAGGAATRGLLGLGLTEAASRRLGMGSSTFWNCIVQRAATEFVRREIRPRLQFHGELKGDESAALPAGIPQPSRVVWIPLRLPDGGRIFLGLGA